ncbi:MAG: hypothetical protein KGY50_04490, partial [Candidatus Thermoplasmatota archaeon]|nr:hypothetical protein [Candidatus Thermoplasmatota archaeon]
GRGTATFTVPITSHCVGVFVPCVPGGNNPIVLPILMTVIIVIIIIAVKYGLSMKRRKKEKRTCMKQAGNVS